MMQLQKNNYGLTGQSDIDFDYFLCGKKCKKRKKEKREIRFERRRLKNDERRADTERTRMETLLMKQSMMPAQVSQAPPAQQSAPTSNSQMTASTPRPQQAGMGSNTMLIVVGVLLVGGFVWTQMNPKNRPVTAIKPAAA
ncbi:hypothetical protein JMN32_00030 [Fulvivirga sp. 29W222]|uniref:Uncharacterized protein n=1 Tax=Fulvivirga marina TaxID=2494733 RepID=A0A937FSV6_9BACT|nr:hypothetical protein [Fulvivirga marina]MBL6444674.1 hypothetical protein [Fulvivirga marina]